MLNYRSHKLLIYDVHVHRYIRLLVECDLLSLHVRGYMLHRQCSEYTQVLNNNKYDRKRENCRELDRDADPGGMQMRFTYIVLGSM